MGGNFEGKKKAFEANLYSNSKFPQNMIIEFSDELDTMNVYAQGKELASMFAQDKDEQGQRVYTWPKTKKQLIYSFSNPVLLTDNFCIAQLSPTLRDSLFNLFQATIKTTTYKTTSIVFNNQIYLGVWGPSIDTLLLCKAIDSLKLSSVQSAAEIGSGSGFVAKHVLKQLPHLENMDLYDLNEHALTCWKDNIDDKRAQFLIGDATQLMQGKTYDLVICNPPYIPRPKSIDDNPYEGVFLIAHLLEQAHTYLNEKGKLILNFSSLCRHLVDPLIEKYNLEMKQLDEMKVPLKVFNVLNNPQWLSYLEQNGLEKIEREGYEYWHTITIFEITKK